MCLKYTNTVVLSSYGATIFKYLSNYVDKNKPQHFILTMGGLMLMPTICLLELKPHLAPTPSEYPSTRGYVTYRPSSEKFFEKFEFGIFYPQTSIFLPFYYAMLSKTY